MYCDWYELVSPLAASGSYTYIRDVVSQELGNTRDLVIYTPPSYYENPFKPFSDLLIMHDGQNLFNASTSFAGVAWQVHHYTVCLLHSCARILLKYLHAFRTVSRCLICLRFIPVWHVLLHGARFAIRARMF